MLCAEPWLEILHWHYAPESGTLRRADDHNLSFVLEPRLHSLLNFFLQHPQLILSKEQILNSVWGDDQGTDAALMRAIATLRKLLDDPANSSVFIETHTRKGYCWVAHVQPLQITKVLAVNASAEVSDSSIELQRSSVLVQEQQDAANNLLTDVLVLRSQQRYATLRYVGLSVTAVLVLCLLFIFLLWRLSSEAYIPSFPYQVNISALPGAEQEPLASEDKQYWYYWYQPESSQGWRLIRHESLSHRKLQLTPAFLAVGQLHWYLDEIVFSAIDDNGCGIFKLNPKQVAPAVKLADCKQLIAKGLTVANGQLFWLDQLQQQTQLWQWQPKQPKLLFSLPGVYRQPIQLLAHEQSFYLLVQEHQLSHQLFRWQQGEASANFIATFPLLVQNLSGWDSDNLLLSGPDKLQLYSLADRRLTSINSHSGLFSDMRRFGDVLLGVAAQNPALDLVPFEPIIEGRRAEVSLPEWLTSNRDDWLFAGRGVFLSTRTGLPQIWRYTNGHLLQLTKLKTVHSFSQLIWHQHELFAVVDQQLMQVDLDSGELLPVDWSRSGYRRYASCEGNWYWAEQDDSGWVLYQQSVSQVKTLLNDVVDMRCGPKDTLVIQHSGKANLSLLKLNSGKVETLPIQLNWRRVNADAWVSNGQTLYWLDENSTLNEYKFESGVSSKLAMPHSLKPEAVYHDTDSPLLFLLQRRSVESEIVLLQTTSPEH